MAAARNPKEVRLSLGVTEQINGRLERLADVAGMNKGAMAAAVLAAGLTTLESAFLGLQPEVMARAAQQLEDMRKRDVEQVLDGDQRG